MGKRQFTAAERNAIYTVHGDKCYLCAKPVDFGEMEVDHVIPEKLNANPQELNEVVLSLGLPADFDVNSFSNWLPACKICNNLKRETAFKPSPIIQIVLQKTAEKAHEVARQASSITSARKVSKAIGVIASAGENGGSDKWDIDIIEPESEFRITKRIAIPAAQPVPITSDHSLALELAFELGPLHGKIHKSGTKQLSDEVARFMILFHPPTASQTTDSRTDNPPSAYFIWKRPCQEIVELAEAEKWTAEERNEKMKHHVYEAIGHSISESIVRFNLRYRGIS